MVLFFHAEYEVMDLRIEEQLIPFHPVVGENFR
jgi:hypothetical protein